MIPDGCVEVSVNSRGQAMIAGPATSFYDLPAGGALVGLRLRPGAAATVLGRPASEFTDRVVPVDTALAEKVFAAKTPAEQVPVLQQLLAERLGDTAPGVDTAVIGAIAMSHAPRKSGVSRRA